MRLKTWLPILGVALLLLAAVGCDDDEVANLPLCGNGTLNGNETCDDGNNADGDGCSSLCTSDITGDYSIDATATADSCSLGDQSFDISIAQAGFGASLTNPLVVDLEFLGGPIESSTVQNFFDRDPVLSGGGEDPFFFSAGICVGGGNDGLPCKGDNFCGGGVCGGACVGGDLAGEACWDDTGCVGEDGVCTDEVCDGGPNDGEACVGDVDCEGNDGTCDNPACGLTAQEDWTLVIDETGNVIAPSTFTLTLGDVPEGCSGGEGTPSVPCATTWDVLSQTR